MFQLLPSAQVTLTPEACMAAGAFVSALPATMQQQIKSIRLFGHQARRFDPDAPFEFLIVVEKRSLEMRSAIGIGRNAVEMDGVSSVMVVIATEEEIISPPDHLASVLRNARREGVDLWLP